MFDDDDDGLGAFLFNNGLSFPANEDILLDSNGFFNSLTEEQAEQLSGYLDEYLPQFR